MYNDLTQLWSLLSSGPALERRRLYIDLAFLTISNVAILYVINQAAGAESTEQIPLDVPLLFIGSVIVSSIKYHSLMRKATLAFTGAGRESAERIVAKVRALHLEHFETVGETPVLLHLTSDVRRLASAGVMFIQVVKAILLYAMTMAWLSLVLSPLVTLVGVAFILLSGFAISAKKQRMTERMSMINTLQGTLYNATEGLLRGFKQVKLNAKRQTDLLQNFYDTTIELQKVRYESYRQYYTDDALSRVVLFGVIGIDAFILPKLFSINTRFIIEVNMAVIYLIRAVTTTISYLPDLMDANAAILRLKSFESQLDSMDAGETYGKKSHGAIMPPANISFHDVEFEYPQQQGGHFRFGPSSLTIKRGELIFVTGSNGSGKSTFIKLLTGLYKPRSGHIAIDGMPLNADALPSYRQLFSPIYSDFILFEKLYAVHSVDETEVTRLLREMELSHVVSFNNGRFSNVQLSTGQRKRLAMVTALLQDRPIYIFDEWAADQDPEFCEVFYKKLLPDLRASGKTIIAVTHDDQYFAVADRRIIFDGGNVQTQ